MNFKKVSAIVLSSLCFVGATALMAADNTPKPASATPAQTNVGQMADNSSMPMGSMPMSSSMPGNSDDVTPDTATGDDDY